MRQPGDRDTLSPICDTHSEISPEHCHPHWRMGGERKRERRGKRGIKGVPIAGILATTIQNL